MRERTDSVSVAIPSLTASTFTWGQTLGGAMWLTDYDAEKTTAGIVDNVQIMDLASNGASIDLVFFESPPATVFTNSATYELAAADAYKVAGIARVTNQFAGSASTLAYLNGAEIAFRLRSGVQLGAVAVARSEMSLKTVNDLLVRIGILEY
jgi:hypothetical protein